MRKGKTEQFDTTAKLLFPIAVFTGGAVMLLSLVGSGSVIAVPTIVGACVIAAIQLIYDSKQRIFTTAALASALVYTCATFIFTRKGLAVTLNALIDSWQQIHPRSYMSFSVAEGNETLCQILFLILISAAAAGFVTFGIRKGSRIVFGIVAIAMIAAALLFQQILVWQYVLAAAASMALWLFSLIGRKGSQGYESMLTGDMAILIRVIPIVLITAVIWGFSVSGEGYIKPVLLKNAEDGLRHTASLLRYGGERNTGMPQGRLYKAKELKFSEGEMLRVTMSSPDSYYLRGFVSGTYEDSRWEESQLEKLSKYADVFYWLHQDDFYGYTQLSQAAVQGTDAGDSHELYVENIGASRKYIYAPYETTSETTDLDKKAVEDSNIRSSGLFGSKEYTLMVKENQVTRFPQIAAGISRSEDGNKYILNESYYNDFVYSNYMDIPENIRMLLTEYLGSYNISPGQIHFDYQMAKQNITYFMTNKMEYDEKVVRIDRDRDFITAFLSDTKKGYSIHYASAAVMMFRYYGIPARYVEGYLLTKEDAANADVGDTVILDGTHAHAWVEYYHDGVGWLPFEVTPSYLSVMPTAEKMQDISGLVGQNGQQQDLDIKEDELMDEMMDQGIDEYWLQSSLIKALIICGLLLMILMLAFMWWIRRGIKKRDMMLASFEFEDVAEAICNIFGYTAKLLLAWGLDPARGSLQNQKEEIVRLMGEEAAHEFEDVVQLYQEAKYSGHLMCEEDRSKVSAFKDKVYETMWSQSKTIERLKYKYMYFL